MLKLYATIGVLASCSAFTAPPRVQIRSALSLKRRAPLLMVSSSPSSSDIPATDMSEPARLSIQITANNFDLTPALKSHTEATMQTPLKKFGMMSVQRVDVNLSVIKHHQPAKRSRAEVTLIVDGQTLRRAEESDDMYVAVEMASHAIRRALGKLKSRKHGVSRHETFVKDALNGEEYAMLEDEDVLVEETELEWPKVTKIKSFDLSKPMSLEDAIFALDFVDHDFYVFRSVDTMEINVIYRRHGGRGVGLIQPEDGE